MISYTCCFINIIKELAIPELPEVQTIKSQLNEYMPFKIHSFSRSNVSDSIIHTKISNLKGKEILQVSRIGKMLDFILDDGRHILSHLGMTGAWVINKNKIIQKHTHLQFKGESDGKEYYLAYVDPRRFGHMYLYDEKQAQKKLAELGTDMKSPEFTFEYFKRALQKYPERLLKVTLLDQKLFAGSGNYIANEICARGGVLPNRQVKTLKVSEIKKLYNAVHLVLDDSIDSGGATFQGGYQDANGDKGEGVKGLVVFYQKTCQLCQKTPVIKIVLAQRGTYYCPKCQK